MLIGSNSIELNEATMIAIVQHYLDTVLLKSAKRLPTVKSVRKSGNGMTDNTFTISLETEQ